MNTILRRLAVLSVLLLSAVTAVALPARAAEPSHEPVILVAKPQLRDRLYGATILIVKPIGNRQHVGLIVNKPTPLTLGRLFPEHEPSQKVVDPVYLGGPVNSRSVSALVQRTDSPGERALQFMPDLYLVLDRDLVDRVIESEAGHARFFAGMVLWAPGELQSELRQGYWYVMDADTSLVLRKPTKGMWEELVKRSQQNARMIRAALER